MPGYIDNIVTLTVDTQNININNIEAACNFGQDQTKIPNKEFTTYLKYRDPQGQDPLDKISWRGIPKATGNDAGCNDKVIITAIWRNLNVGNINVLSDFSENTNQEISATPIQVGLEKYTLYFMVYNWVSGTDYLLRGVYYIDPKIAVNP